jgi:hypothetical protein
LAVAAQRFRIEVLFTIALSNHHHTGIYDPHGNYPEFLELFHKLFAKCQNVLRRRWENFWSAEQTSVVRLVSKSDIINKLAYALSNPAKDHLVEKSTDWPGVTSLPALLAGKDLLARRPKHFFREDGEMPTEATLTFTRPKGFEDLSQHEFATLVMARIEKVEQDARRERRGGRVLGVKAVLRQRPTDRPTDAEPRRELNPRVAAQNKWQRVEALIRNKRFQRAYAKARDAFKLGLGNVMFPEGTYWMARFAGVLVPLPPR